MFKYGEEENAYWVFVGKHDDKRPLGKFGYRWEENVKMDGSVWTGFIWLMIDTSGRLL